MLNHVTHMVHETSTTLQMFGFLVIGHVFSQGLDVSEFGFLFVEHIFGQDLDLFNSATISIHSRRPAQFNKYSIDFLQNGALFAAQGALAFSSATKASSSCASGWTLRVSGMKNPFNTWVVYLTGSLEL